PTDCRRRPHQPFLSARLACQAQICRGERRKTPRSCRRATEAPPKGRLQAWFAKRDRAGSYRGYHFIRMTDTLFISPRKTNRLHAFLEPGYSNTETAPASLGSGT